MMVEIRIFLITGLVLSVSTHMSRGSYADRKDPFSASRTKRNLEGQPCTRPSKEENGTACILAYTTCNPETHKCECDKNVSVAIKMTSYPELVQCIPFDYVRTTGHCVPTSPDICGVLVAGAFCDAPKKRVKNAKGQLSCSCQVGGEYPNCTIKIGTVCKDDATCTKDIPNSYCAKVNTTDGLGKCACGQFPDGRQYASDTKGLTCQPVNCAAKPCRGQASASTCVDLKDGYKCNCNNNTKGRSHSLQVDGICCPANQIPCLDLKKCLFVEELCDGKSDCEDCSDEKQFYCTGLLPMDNPQCRSVSRPSTSTNYPTIPLGEMPAVGEATRNTRPITNFATAPMAMTYSEADPNYKPLPLFAAPSPDLTPAAVQRLMEPPPNW